MTDSDRPPRPFDTQRRSLCADAHAHAPELQHAAADLAYLRAPVSFDPEGIDGREPHRGRVHVCGCSRRGKGSASRAGDRLGHRSGPEVFLEAGDGYVCFRWFIPVDPNKDAELAQLLAQLFGNFLEPATSFEARICMPDWAFDANGRRFDRDAAANMPMFVFTHGVGGNYQHWDTLLAAVAKKGIIAVSIPSGSPIEARIDLLRLSVRPLREYFYVAWSLTIPAGRIAFGGGSQGGAAALRATSASAGLASAAVAIAPASALDVDLHSASALVIAGTHDRDSAPHAVAHTYDRLLSNGDKGLVLMGGTTHEALHYTDVNDPIPGDFFQKTRANKASSRHFRDLLTAEFLAWQLQSSSAAFFDWILRPHLAPVFSLSQRPSSFEFQLRNPVSDDSLSPGEERLLFDPQSLPCPLTQGLPPLMTAKTPTFVRLAYGCLENLIDPSASESIPVCLEQNVTSIAPNEGIRVSSRRAVRVGWNEILLENTMGRSTIRLQIPYLGQFLPIGIQLSQLYIAIDLALVVNADLNLENQKRLGGPPWELPSAQQQYVIEDWRPEAALSPAFDPSDADVTWVKPTGLQAVRDHGGYECALSITSNGVKSDYRGTQFTTVNYALSELLAGQGLQMASGYLLFKLGTAPHSIGDAFIGRVGFYWEPQE